MLRVHGVEGKLFVESGAEFYVDSMACVRVEIDVGAWFPVNVELK